MNAGSYLATNFRWGTEMFFNLLRTSFRLILKDKQYSIINQTGDIKLVYTAIFTGVITVKMFISVNENPVNSLKCE